MSTIVLSGENHHVDALSGGSNNSVVSGDDDLIFSDRFEDLTHNANAFAYRILDRITYGARPEDIVAFNALGSNPEDRLSAFVDQQLNWAIDQ